VDRGRLGLALVTLMLLVTLPFPGWTQSKHPAPKSERALKAPTGTTIVFHGWSKDNRHIAYRWTRVRPRKNRKALVTIRKHHRLVWKNRISGFGPYPGRDIAAYAKKRGYILSPLKGKEGAKAHWTFKSARGTYHFRVKAGKRLTWSLSLDNKTLMSERCNNLYVKITPSLYPAPNGKSILIVLKQDTGWSREDVIHLAGVPPLPGRVPQHR
jgi:hypothetical protein